jgi:hypothetical protein
MMCISPPVWYQQTGLIPGCVEACQCVGTVSANERKRCCCATLFCSGSAMKELIQSFSAELTTRRGTTELTTRLLRADAPTMSLAPTSCRRHKPPRAAAELATGSGCADRLVSSHLLATDRTCRCPRHSAPPLCRRSWMKVRRVRSQLPRAHPRRVFSTPACRCHGAAPET